VTPIPKNSDPTIKKFWSRLKLLLKAAISEKKPKAPKIYLVKMHKGQAYKAKTTSMIQARTIMLKAKIALFR
jgi:hypothetical protein